MFLKIMNQEDNSPDSDSRATFMLHDFVLTADFEREDGKAFVQVLFADGDRERFEVTGNAYLMNDQGKTVASFGAMPYVPLPRERGNAGEAVPDGIKRAADWVKQTEGFVKDGGRLDPDAARAFATDPVFGMPNNT